MRIRSHARGEFTDELKRHPGAICTSAKPTLLRSFRRQAKNDASESCRWRQNAAIDIPLAGCSEMIFRHCSPEIVRLRMAKIMPGAATGA